VEMVYPPMVLPLSSSFTPRKRTRSRTGQLEIMQISDINEKRRSLTMDLLVQPTIFLYCSRKTEVSRFKTVSRGGVSTDTVSMMMSEPTSIVVALR
jgi:hypothetical protein